MFMPWAYFHNYKHTGKFFPYREFDEVYILRSFNFSEHLKTLKFFSNTPFSNIKKWKSPYVFPDGGELTKNNDYLSYTFITSIIGEYRFYELYAFFIWIIWSMLLVHLIAHIISLKEIFKTQINKIAFSLVFFSHLIHFANILRIKIPLWYIGVFMDYRFLLWNVIGWAILYLSIASKSKFFLSILIVGIILQLHFLTIAVWEAPRFPIPRIFIPNE
jgi:hypothetical protein